MNRRLRAFSAMVAIVAMLFAPIAMALHACPSADDVAGMHSVAAHVATAAADAPDEAGAPMDMSPCERHCAQAKAGFDLAKSTAPAAVPVVPAVRVPALAPLRVAAVTRVAPFAAVAGPAPPLLRYTVLRI